MWDLFFVALGAGAIAFVFFLADFENRVIKRLERLRPRNAEVAHVAQIRISHPAQPTRRWSRAILYVSNKHIVIHRRTGTETPIFYCLGHEIEGFWRPRIYQPGINSIEIHANVAGQWTILKVRLTRSRMMALVRALKYFVNDDIERSYRQRRPYIYRPPAPARLATQDIYGMWHYERAFNVYLNPASLVFLGEGDAVERVINLRHLQNIRILRSDESNVERGLVCFRVTPPDDDSLAEDVAISVDDYSAWAESIALAARRTLEEPITRKRKGKKASAPEADDRLSDEDFDAPEDAFDMALWESQAYVLGDDGELRPR
ncbi:MAG: hypothetical protein EA396_09405 [Anaerolineaceae bacterium]|nr:MAG: hypothetical protein EA396_09405 [Anaerolineaceae bacterium]